ncbi:hypothetical protein Xaut_5077 (plasmid) [Xanthobacter versatilis]|uniref:Transposase DDE domain-containing protein n=1 Tax=Xanthobacter autotrophicus (strain ATCC BAA-1158 / Py2) TaxID=78245 RepID=A7IQH9_XANP2|nr:hypothetical protein Xaut_5077 [Xanthobacter autotrophicus Py2]
MLLAMAERRLGIAERLARAFPDRRDPSRITHTLADMIRARTFAIACGYEEADNLDCLRTDPAFKLACGRLPDSGADLCSQPTLSRLENAPSLKDAIRLTFTLVDQWIASYERESASVILEGAVRAPLTIDRQGMDARSERHPQHRRWKLGRCRRVAAAETKRQTPMPPHEGLHRRLR